MVNFAVVKTGGKQYLVKEQDIITVDKLPNKEKETVELPVLAMFDNEGKSLKLGMPTLAKGIKAEVISQVKGDKIRVAKFKAKVRYRKVTGFRPHLTQLKIVKIG